MKPADKDGKTLIRKDSLKDLVEKYQSSTAAKDLLEAGQNGNVVALPLSSLSLFPLLDCDSYSDEEIQKISASLEKEGQKFPLFVCRYEGLPFVINGAKRYLAGLRLGLARLNVVYIEYSLEEIIAYIIVDLLQEKANGMRMSCAFNCLIQQFGYTEKDICELTGLSHGQINNELRLSKLAPAVKKMIVNGKLTSAKGRLLIPFEPELQQRLAEEFVPLSVRDCEEKAREAKEEGNGAPKRKKMTYRIEGSKITIVCENAEELEEIEEYLKERGEKC
jgi:ParB family transcriptional regulator, chromosome partitioning protein